MLQEIHKRYVKFSFAVDFLPDGISTKANNYEVTKLKNANNKLETMKE